MCEGTREDGSTIEPNDPFWDRLTARAKRAREDPIQWLEMRQIYGDLADQPRLAEAFTRGLRMIRDQGMDHAIDTYLAE